MGNCRFQHSWLEKTDTRGYKVSSWAMKKDDSHIWCTFCEASINITSKGFQAISQHSEVKRHIKNVEIKYGPRQLHLTAMPGSSESDDHRKSTSKLVSLCSTTDKIYKAELIWTMKCIAANYSGKSCNGIAHVFRAMFPEESIVLNDFSLAETKFSYLVSEALGPYFKEKMLEDVYKSYYSLLYDETTNNEGKKELQIGLKYWSEKKNEVITSHLTTIFMGSAKADEISCYILKSLDKDSLSLNKLIMIGSDGPPVNEKVFRILNDAVKSLPGRMKGLLQVGTCNLHTINNTFLKGLDVFGHEVSELIIGVYYYFHGWPLRNEEYLIAQEKKKVPHHKFIKHSTIRWLTLQNAVLRMLEQWPAVVYYFLEYIPSKKSNIYISQSSYKRITNLLLKKSMKAQLHFILSVTQVYSKFSIMFQREEPLIHVLYDELRNLLLTIMRRICKKDFVDEAVIREDFENSFEEENLMFSKSIICDSTVIAELKKIPESDQKEFLQNVRKHYVASGKYLFQISFKSKNMNLKHFNFLQINEISNEKSSENLIKIAKSLPGSINMSMLIDEWHLLQTEQLCTKSDIRIDHFWHEIFQIKNSFSQTKYPILQMIVKMCLSVSHGSADIERGFSLSGRIISEDRTNISERTLNAKLYIMDALKHYNYQVQLVPITSELLFLAKNACKRYKEHLKEEKTATGKTRRRRKKGSKRETH